MEKDVFDEQSRVSLEKSLKKGLVSFTKDKKHLQKMSVLREQENVAEYLMKLPGLKSVF